MTKTASWTRFVLGKVNKAIYIAQWKIKVAESVMHMVEFGMGTIS